ncbi:MAG: protease modulator HflK [Verrucomicrobiia bacterium]
MSDEHEQHLFHGHAPEPAPVTQDDAGSQAMAEAMRSSFAIVKFVMVVLVILFLASGIFQVGPQEQAIVLRFGKPVGTGEQALLGPGLHWAFPYPIDEVVKIPIKQIQSVQSTVGWFAETPEQELSGNPPPPGPSLIPGVDGYTITADRNIIHTRATLYYQVDNPTWAVFDFSSGPDSALGMTGVSNAVLNVLNNALLYTAAHSGVDQVLYSDVGGFQDDVEQRVIQLADQEHLGITIRQCNVYSIPPRQLQQIFDQVTEATQNRNQMLDEAHSYENQVTNNADAQASAIINEAQSASVRYVQSVQADAKAFSDLLPNYKINPNLFEQEQLVQVMGESLTNVQFKGYMPTTTHGKPTDLWLLLNREPPEPKTGAAAQQ